MRELKERLDVALSSSSGEDDDGDDGGEESEEEVSEHDGDDSKGVHEAEESPESDAGIDQRQGDPAEAGGSGQARPAQEEERAAGHLHTIRQREDGRPPPDQQDAAVEVPDYAEMHDVDDEAARKSMRAGLKSMSIEEIQKLKQKIGLKLFDKALRGGGARDEKRRRHFPRDNKNRPREMSSKRTVARFRDVVGVSGELADKETNKRDPRFDSLCGNFDQKLFRESYKFVDSIRSDERKKLAAELDEETDPERIKKIKYLIQRYDNQIRERDRLEKSKSAREAEKAEMKSLSKAEGTAVVYTSKREAKNRELVAKFEELKKGGKLDNYVRRKSKKQTAKDRKRMRNS